MRSLHSIFLIVILISITGYGYSQAVIEPASIADIAEELAADENDPDAAVIFMEDLSGLAENPVKINSGDENEISRLFFLSGFQVKSLADYVKRTGTILSVYEIASIAGFDTRIVEIMTPFITLADAGTFRVDSLSVHSTLISNLIFNPGKNDTLLAGSGVKSLTKFRITAGKFSAGFTAEKDPGEKLFSGSPPLPDFLSFYSSFSGKGVIKRIVLGDFSMHFGEGTCINTSMRTGLRLTQSGLTSGRDYLKPYTSSEENNFFRGAAAEISAGKCELIMFFSRNLIDATLEPGPDSTMFVVSNLFKTGIHSNPSSISRKDNLSETAYGVNLSFDGNHVRAGINWSETRFSLPFSHEPDDPETIYDFEGRCNSLLSVNYTTLAGRILLFGEMSLNNKVNFAILQGAVIRASDRLTVNLLYNKYSPGFTAFNGRGPGTGSETGNEEGITGNFSFEAARHLFIFAGSNISWYPWIRYRCSFPSLARKYEILVRYLPSEKINLELSYGYKYAMYNLSRNSGAAASTNSISHTCRLLFRYVYSEKISLSTRFSFKSSSPGRSEGAMVLQDVYYNIPRIRASIWFRYCLFGTDGWDSRLYVYENDLLYSFSIPALSGEGSRSYLMGQFEIGRHSVIRIKYGVTSISVPGLRDANTEEIKCQLRTWF